MNLIQYLMHRATWQKLPVMPRHYSTDFQARGMDDDTATLMKLSHIRSPHNVRLLSKKHGKTARQLVTDLPKRRRPRNIARRFLALLQRAAGVTPYDPMATIAREQRKRRGGRYRSTLR